MDKINSTHIVRIKRFLNQEYIGYEYKPEIKFLFLTLRKGGFYCTWSLESTCLSKEDLESKYTDLFVKDNTAYRKPYIILYLSNSQTKVITFESEQELNTYLEREEIKNIKWI